jgi:hypothetical protein
MMRWRRGDLPAGFVSEGVSLGLHLCGYGGPTDAFEVTSFNDCEQQVLVSFVVPLGRHVVIRLRVMSLRRETRR